ncbi:hypothetical protein CFC21_080621 [Triticum aestivum]|uniref:phosphatidylglycerophosphatase n=4 Tax=Triticinae TaxID=1648030 RepID=A0A9R1I315_WHEAT|nr:phosphatidylglycerophosphate phosphatase PTPMT2-like [Aegilops tauschii subsp. strangulata]XP_044402383.1 phosphatidylglycerophosphate phosphatase PTPMT2-like [Triticum aestivum]KAF7075887.1 hypothetical protein CFC21_080621 [Triticum aestivum]
MRSDELPVDSAGVELQLFHGHNDGDGSARFVDEEAWAESSSATALDVAKRAAVGVGARVLFYPKLAYKLVAGRSAPGKASEESSSSSSATTLDAAKQAAVGVGARALFYPTLAYSLARNRLSPAGFKWWHKITDTHMLLGAVPFPSDVPRLRALGVTAVVTLTEPYERLVDAKLYKAHGMENLVLPTTDYLYAPSQKDLRDATAFIHGKEGGGLTYVHCKAGRARSATVVMCYLVRYKGMTTKQAYDHVRSCRSRVSLAPAQWQAVQDFEDFYRRPAGSSE